MRRTHFIAVALVVTLAVTSNASAQTYEGDPVWRRVDALRSAGWVVPLYVKIDGDGHTVSGYEIGVLSPSRVKRLHGQVYAVWIKWLYLPDRKVDGVPAYDSSLEKREVDCSDLRSRSVAAYVYKNDDQVWGVDSLDRPFTDAVPDTIGETTLVAACKHLTAAAKDKTK